MGGRRHTPTDDCDGLDSGGRGLLALMLSRHGRVTSTIPNERSPWVQSLTVSFMMTVPERATRLQKSSRVSESRRASETGMRT